MSSIFYVHTARFLGEVYGYFDRFSQFQALMVAMRSSDVNNLFIFSLIKRSIKVIMQLQIIILLFFRTKMKN